MLALGFVLGFAAGGFVSLVITLVCVVAFRDLFGPRPDGDGDGPSGPPPAPTQPSPPRKEFAELFPEARHYENN